MEKILYESLEYADTIYLLVAEGMAEADEILAPEKEHILNMHAPQRSLKSDGKSFKGWYTTEK